MEGDHALWRGVSDPYKHTIRAFLVQFHTAILSHNSGDRFSFRNGSVGAWRGGASPGRQLLSFDPYRYHSAPTRPYPLEALAAVGMVPPGCMVPPARIQLTAVLCSMAPPCPHAHHDACALPRLRASLCPGNFFFAGARIFFRSLEAAIFLFARVARLPEGSHVLPAIATEQRITLGGCWAGGWSRVVPDRGKGWFRAPHRVRLAAGDAWWVV